MDVRDVSRRFGVAALVIGPVGLVLGALFQVAGDDDSVSQSLAKIAAHPGRQRAEIVFDLLVAFMLPAMLYLMRLAGTRAPRLALAGGTIAFAAWLAGLLSLGASDILLDHAARLPERATAVSLVHAVTGDPSFVILEAVFIIGHLVGMLLLGVALWRGRAVPRWAAVLVGLASVAHLIVHDLSGVVDAATFALLAIGMAACAVALARTAEPPATVPVPQTLADSAGQPVARTR